MSHFKRNGQNPLNASDNQPKRKVKVLLVDDEKVIHSLLTEFLTVKGFDLHSAFTISEAKRLIQSDIYDIVITDYKMPDGNGTEVVTFVKQNQAGTKILGISGNENGKRFYAAGADSFISKPFRVTTILQIITSLLEDKIKDMLR